MQARPYMVASIKQNPNHWKHVSGMGGRKMQADLLQSTSGLRRFISGSVSFINHRFRRFSAILSDDYPEIWGYVCFFILYNFSTWSVLHYLSGFSYLTRKPINSGLILTWGLNNARYAGKSES